VWAWDVVRAVFAGGMSHFLLFLGMAGLRLPSEAHRSRVWEVKLANGIWVEVEYNF